MQKVNQSYPHFTPPSRIPKVLGISRSTALRKEKKDPSFPRRRRIGPGLTGFVTAELIEWAETREEV
jgi:predicted DNA-binding transcriptional regulator AlpA